ncbi:MAG: porin, partial [Proteobacteria bacterium]|nr:porin [Pseudomonadota bacterium]
ALFLNFGDSLMKKTLIALAALGVVGAASAQATIYGVVDVGIKNTGSATTVASGLAATPRIGLKGKEDLGGGLSASWMVEAGYNNVKEAAADTAGTNFGDRGASLSIGGSFGEITMGASVLSPSFFAAAPNDPTGAANYMPAQGAQWAASRNDNNISYKNTIGGVTVRAAVVSKDDNSGQAVSDISAVYSANGFTVSASSYSGASKTTYVGASYNFGVAKLYAGKTSTGVDRTTLGISAPMGPMTLQAGSYKDNKAGTSATLVAAVYALSKTTSLNTYYQSPKGSDATLGLGFTHKF